VPQRCGLFKADCGNGVSDFLQANGLNRSMENPASQLSLILHFTVNAAQSLVHCLTTKYGMHIMKFFLGLLASSFFYTALWAAGPVNVNTASAEEISESLKGIGLSKAQLIVEYREANGSFVHMDELVNVKGIGLKTVDQNRDLIIIQDENVSANN
jgi:competence protein ComEA